MTKSIFQVSNFRPGMHRLKADDLNSMLDVCKAAAGEGGGVQFYIEESWPGIIDPSGKSDYTDERYWIKRARCSNVAGDIHSQITFEVLPTEDAKYQQTTATNLAEFLTGSHSLSVDSIVHILALRDKRGVKHYYFWQGQTLDFYARITGATPLADNRWSYAFAEVELNLVGTFTTKSGGRTGAAYNTIEANNSASGVQGSGDDVDDFPSGIVLQPIGVGAVVLVRTMINCEDAPEYLFTVPNNAGGTCT